MSMRTLLLAILGCACSGVYAVEPAELVSEAAARAVLGWMSAQGVTGVVQPRSMSRLVDVSPAALTMMARPIQADQVRSRMVVWVDLRAGERFVRSVPVVVDVAPSMAAAALPEAADVQPDAMGDTPSSAVLAGKPVAVRRGEWAALRTREGAVLLEGRVEVLQDGRAGDRIRVRQQGATGIVLARVIGRGQLELAP